MTSPNENTGFESMATFIWQNSGQIKVRFVTLPVMDRTEKRGPGRPRRQLPDGVAPNAFALWLMGNKEFTVESVADLLGVATNTVYGWRRGTGAPTRRRAATIERISEGAVPASSWD